MADFRLEVFYTVAKRLSFTKAATELFITQPAITKHIRELEEQYKTKLFERNGNKIKLSLTGELLLKHTEDIFAVYRRIDFDLHDLTQHNQGLLRMGASTTIAQYVIAPLLAGFKEKFAAIQLSLINGNTEQIEKALLAREIELGLIEGRSKNQEISYHEFIKDEIVLVCSKNHPWAKKASIKTASLKEVRLVLREQGSGTLEVIDYAFKSLGLSIADLNVEIHLGNAETIKSYLLHTNCMAFLSVHAVAKELQNGELRIIDVEGLTIERKFYMIRLQGKAEGLVEIFMRFAKHYHNLK
ncbi:LysR substrate-binding domain-containing protein [Mucilaginibacter arboris]|uniref:LysR family transcriptional regulator n=1 Tax=Mucilaginibacter arboris TaxID=2682090 RepID=A0A7K1SWR1_9SPHI|nr:LysR substrate-binding domain-containing protein [Mucilaginibacter arboris]MVN21723.1 LysR family transcriptional regulator [Mucilaginibacter arboris]